MQIIANCTQEVLKKAAKALFDGCLVAFPTETVYGLGADATNEKAVSRIYSVKGRPIGHPLIVHISSFKQLDKWAIDVSEYAVDLAKEFWPGPMTLILKRSDLAKDFITGGQDNVGLRVPNQPIAIGLLEEFEIQGGLGVAAPSANKFGAVSPTSASAVEEEIGMGLGIGDLILDGGRCSVGVESTIIDCTQANPVILRPGWITYEEVERCTGLKIELINSQSGFRASGLLESHYSPKAKVVLDVSASPGEGFFAMDIVSTPQGAIRLGSPKTIEQYASDVYAALRYGDQKNLAKIVVIQPSGGGLAIAIRDRLGKAAQE
jgi:L-threonylcarbamoyladenylate synthase